MDQSIYLFYRETSFTDGRPARQAVSVYATDAQDAQQVLGQYMENLRTTTSYNEPSYEPSESWIVSEVPLDTSKVVTFEVTG